MTSYVLDASVAAKWFLPASTEPLTDEAARLLDRFAAGETRFFVPDLFWPEFGNILWKAARQGRWSRDSALEAIRAMKDRRLPTTPSASLIEEAFQIAEAFGRTVYDCVYVALALHRDAPMVTADERLTHALSLHFPIRWLGSI